MHRQGLKFGQICELVRFLLGRSLHRRRHHRCSPLRIGHCKLVWTDDYRVSHVLLTGTYYSHTEPHTSYEAHGAIRRCKLTLGIHPPYKRGLILAMQTQGSFARWSRTPVMTKHELYYSRYPIPDAEDAAPLRGAGASPLPLSIVSDNEVGLVSSAPGHYPSYSPRRFRLTAFVRHSPGLGLNTHELYCFHSVSSTSYCR